MCLQFLSWLSNKLQPLKHILALTTYGQKFSVSELQPFTLVIFQTEHHVETQHL